MRNPPVKDMIFFIRLSKFMGWDTVRNAYTGRNFFQGKTLVFSCPADMVL